MVPQGAIRSLFACAPQPPHRPGIMPLPVQALSYRYRGASDRSSPPCMIPANSSSTLSMSNRQDFPNLNPGNFPCDAKLHTVLSFKRRKSATSRTVANCMPARICLSSLSFPQQNPDLDPFPPYRSCLCSPLMGKIIQSDDPLQDGEDIHRITIRPRHVTRSQFVHAHHGILVFIC
jgi:hypothetical protein